MEVPLTALRQKAVNIICELLNSTKVLPSPEELPRDWRGLAHLAGVPSPPSDCPNPTSRVLELWAKRRPQPSVKTLQDYLGRLDRWDVYDETLAFIDEDVEEYHERINGGNYHLLHSVVYRMYDEDVAQQTYDAFLLYSDEDEWFAKLIVDNLENRFGLRLCLKDRDMVAGLHELESITHMIAEKCNFVIVVVSDSFFKSKYNQFLVTFAQTFGIQNRRRKLVPCVYSRLRGNMPYVLSSYTILDFTRSQNSQISDFWEQLRQSVKIALPLPSSQTPRAIEAPPTATKVVPEVNGEARPSIEYPKRSSEGEEKRQRSGPEAVEEKSCGSKEAAKDSTKGSSKSQSLSQIFLNKLALFEKKKKKKRVAVECH